MIATSLGDVFTLKDFPKILFTRKYRGRTFVAYNLKYDEGALLQVLPRENLEELRIDSKTKHNGYTYKIIPKKMLTVSKGKNNITLYDLANFFKTSLDNATKSLLGESKIDIGTKDFTPEYVAENWDKIAEYCIKDADLAQRLATVLIERFETFGVYPKRLYSTAYISYQYFSSTCKYPVVKRYWNYYKRVLYFAMQSYNGGKFEVTEKGQGYFYEYDVNSQYPSQIKDLVDVSEAIVIHNKEYIKEPIYGFIDCNVKLPVNVSNPVALKHGAVNVFPCGEFRKIMTKKEYEYLDKQGAELEVNEAWYLHVTNITYPFRKEIIRLTNLKNELKATDNKIDYHIIKILLNSLYGKFVQLIDMKDHYKASSCWNPIFGSIITANSRIQVTEMQQKYDDIIAVHTDSIISKSKLPLKDKGQLGEFVFEVEGEGLILGSGIYQIGDKNKFRGFNTSISIKEIVTNPKLRGKIKTRRPLTWREVVFHNWELININKFTEINKVLNVNFDKKRIWLNDWKSFNDVLERNVLSVPLYSSSVFNS